MQSRWVLVFFLGLFLSFGPAVAASNPTDSPEPAAPPQTAGSSSASLPSAMVAIPGPLRSFLRMAAISQKASPDEVLPFFARNVFANGYRRGEATEYLNLLQGYLKQAKELSMLADADGVLRVASCKDAQPLLAALGYHLRNGCGPEATLESADADRAFLSIDSGFPVADLEETLRSDKPFAYPVFVQGAGAFYAR